MRYIPPKFTKLSEMAQIDAARLTEDEARGILEGIRWPDGITCSHCESEDVTRLLGKSKKTRDGVFQCNDCRGQFTVTHGTVMQGSHITLRQWVQAFYSMCSHKKGVSALQLQRNLGLGSYHSALHLANRIRLAMREDPLVFALKGTVEVDETYIGGKPRKSDNNIHKRDRGTRKAPVMVLVERQGKSVSHPIERVNAWTLKTAIKEVVNKSATIMTDEWVSYRGIGKEFDGGHKVVNHGMGQYVMARFRQILLNLILLKRGIHGTFHHVSKNTSLDIVMNFHSDGITEKLMTESGQ